MAPEYIAVTVSVSVLGGVVIIALIVVCIVKATSNTNFDDSKEREREYVDMTALQEALDDPSYIHYPEPEPYTPTHIPEADPWRMNPLESSPANIRPPHDVPDHGQDPFRRQSIIQPYSRPPKGASDLPKRHSYAQGMPRRWSNAQGSPRRQSQVEGMLRRASRAGDIEGNRGRRTSIAQNRRSSAAGQMQKLPTRRGSLQPNPEPPTGEKKLWYFYLNEERDYFSSEGLERNKMQRRMSQVEKRGGPHSEAADSRLQRRDSRALPHPRPHPKPYPRPRNHPRPYQHNTDPRSLWM